MGVSTAITGTTAPLEGGAVEVEDATPHSRDCNTIEAVKAFSKTHMKQHDNGTMYNKYLELKTCCIYIPLQP